MKILLSHFGSPYECLIATSVIKRLHEDFDKPEVYCLANNLESQLVFQYNKKTKEVFLNTLPDGIVFDRQINLHPNYTPERCKENYGFNTNKNVSGIYEVLYGTKGTNKSLFQLYFRLAGMTWRGEGFDFNYFPKSKNRRDYTGVAVADDNLRGIVVNSLKLNQSKLCNALIKNSVYRQFDEINRYNNIITDDLLILNIALSLRKKVFFLKTKPINYRIELFGSGHIFEVSNENRTT